MNKIVVMLSNRHVHLTPASLEVLFGSGYELQLQRDLGGGEFAAEETIDIATDHGRINQLRVLGPLRNYTQVELLKSDCYKLQIDPPIVMSGNLANAVTLTLIGPKGEITLNCGIIAQRHVHLTPDTAANLDVKPGDEISLMAEGERSIVFNNVGIKLYPGPVDLAHLDLDEGNAANLSNGDFLFIVKNINEQHL